MIKHPLEIGTQLLSVNGELDCDENDRERATGPLATGTVISADWSEHQGWTYGVTCPNGTWVFIDQLDSVDDVALYRVVQKGERQP